MGRGTGRLPQRDGRGGMVLLVGMVTWRRPRPWLKVALVNPVAKHATGSGEPIRKHSLLIESEVGDEPSATSWQPDFGLRTH